MALVKGWDIYWAASEQSVLEVDVLDAGEMDRSKDLSNFDKGQIVMARRRSGHLRNGKACGVLPVSSGEYLPTVVRGGTNHKPATVFGAQGSSMREGNEGYPVWSEPTEFLLWHKSQKILMVVTGEMPQSTVHRILLRMGLRSRRVPMMTSVYR